MNVTRVKKTELMEKLLANRSEHRAIFEEALEGFRTQVIQEAERIIREAKAGKRFNHKISLVQPIDQTREYDRAIKMIEMSVDEIIELDEHKFQCLVMDDWSWKSNFLASNAGYSKLAADSLNK